MSQLYVHKYSHVKCGISVVLPLILSVSSVKKLWEKLEHKALFGSK